MAIRTEQLVIFQGATFRQSFVCDLSDQGIAFVGTFANGGANTFSLASALKGDSNFSTVASGVVIVTVGSNSVTLEIDESLTANFPVRKGRFVVEVTNGTDRWRIMEGGWRLDRDAA